MPLTEEMVTIVDASPVRPDEADRDPPSPAIPPEVQDALRRQVAQAIQPVLADFRKQSVRAVREQVEQAQEADRGEGTEEARPAAEPGGEERPTPSLRGDRDSGQPDGVDGRTPLHDGAGLAQAVASDVVGQVPGFLEEASTQWLRSRLEDGRDALCSTRVRDGVRRSVDHAVHPFLEAGLELVPGDAARRALQQESEQALDELIEDALGRFCSEQVLADLQRHGERAIHALVQGDIGAALQEVWRAVQALLRALLAAVQDEWQRLIHLLLNVLLKAAQEMIGTILKEGLAALMPVSVEEIEEKAEAATETLQDRAAELKERLAERVGALQERVQEEVGQVKQRVADGLKSAVEDGTRNSSFGRPPTGRPPSLRPPSGRPPTGRPPSARPPTGRPPSLTRRAT